MFNSLYINKLNGILYGNQIPSVKQYLIYNFIVSQLSTKKIPNDFIISPSSTIPVPEYWTKEWDNVVVDVNSLEYSGLELILKSTIVPHGTMQNCLEEIRIEKIT